MTLVRFPEGPETSPDAISDHSRITPESIEQLRDRELALSELENWEDAIDALNLALTDAAVCRDRLAGLADLMESEEAKATLEATGSNAEQRKASLTIALNAEGAEYAKLAAQSRAIRLKLADAERRAEIARQRCRLLREAVALQVALRDA